MVLELQLRLRPRLPAIVRAAAQLAAAAGALALSAIGSSATPARADDMVAAGWLRDSQNLVAKGQYFDASRYAFAAGEEDPGARPDAYARISQNLTRAGLLNSASYFFIRTLQTDDRSAIRRVLTDTQELLLRQGADLFRPYLIRHTKYEDYDAINRSAYLFALAKTAILQHQEERAVQYLNAIHPQSPLGPNSLHLRGTAYAILGKDHQALDDFRECAERSRDALKVLAADAVPSRIRQVLREAEDLQARCVAGQGRTLYQMEQFDDADRTYDHIPKASLVWPDILFEQAWNSFGKREYNRTLGKLVSYKSPALSFVFSSEVDVLRAQSYLALCLYGDANDTINEFNGKYEKVGEQVKDFVERNSADLPAFYGLGKESLEDSLYSKNELHRIANRFVRGPYFQGLAVSEREVGIERAAIRRFSSLPSGLKGPSGGKGFPGFLEQVLSWRLRAVRLLGGAFVKNSLIDHHAGLIADFEKMAFIKLEMLKRAKEALIHKNRIASTQGDRSRGNVEPSRRDDQYYWSFNGEFWNDELGDYVFGLESQCRGSEGA